METQKKLVRAKEAAAMLGIGVSTLWKWVKAGRLPQGVRLSARCTCWRLADIERFIDDKADENYR